MCAASPHGAARPPPDKRLHSACRGGGRIKRAEAAYRPAWLFGPYAFQNCGRELARDSTLPAYKSLSNVPNPVGASEGCDLLTLPLKNQIKRSQPRFTRQLLQATNHHRMYPIQTVGASLLAIAVCQAQRCRLYGRHRQQAGSYRNCAWLRNQQAPGKKKPRKSGAIRGAAVMLSDGYPIRGKPCLPTV